MPLMISLCLAAQLQEVITPKEPGHNHFSTWRMPARSTRSAFGRTPSATKHGDPVSLAQQQPPHREPAPHVEVRHTPAEAVEQAGGVSGPLGMGIVSQSEHRSCQPGNFLSARTAHQCSIFTALHMSGSWAVAEWKHYTMSLSCIASSHAIC